MRCKFKSVGLWLGVCSSFFLAVVFCLAWAQSAPRLIGYQGRLTDNAGMPLDGETVDLTFGFYDAPSGGTLLLAVVQEDVLVTSGIYSVEIGSGAVTPGAESNLADVFQKHGEVWMGVKVDNDPEMTPRNRMGSVPYTLQADNGIPKGGIIMRSGAITAITPGWALCDGTNGTPDLTDRFVMGAPAGQDPGQTGGANQKTLALDEMPTHSHNITITMSGAHDHQAWDEWRPNINADFWIGGLAPTSLTYDEEQFIDQSGTTYDGAHTHAASASLVGGNAAFDNRPAYYTIAFIMKM